MTRPVNPRVRLARREAAAAERTRVAELAATVRPSTLAAGRAVADLCGSLLHLYGDGGDCYICRYNRGGGHCPLYEMCVGCNNDLNPCGVTVWLRADLDEMERRHPTDRQDAQ